MQPADNAADDTDEEEAVGSLHSLGRRSLGVAAGPEPPIVEPAAPSRCPSGLHLPRELDVICLSVLTRHGMGVPCQCNEIMSVPGSANSVDNDKPLSPVRYLCHLAHTSSPLQHGQQHSPSRSRCVSRCLCLQTVVHCKIPRVGCAGGVGCHAAGTMCAPAARAHASHRSAAPAAPRRGAAWAPAAGTAWRPLPALQGRIASCQMARLGPARSAAAAPTAAPHRRSPRSRLRWRPTCLSMRSQQMVKGLQAMAAQTAGATTPQERTTARTPGSGTTGRTPCRRGCCLVAPTSSAGSPTRAACATTQVRWWLLRCSFFVAEYSWLKLRRVAARGMCSPRDQHTCTTCYVRCIDGAVSRADDA